MFIYSRIYDSVNQVLIDGHSDCFQVFFYYYKQSYSVYVHTIVPYILSDRFTEEKLLMRECIFFNFQKLYHITLQKGCYNVLLHQICVKLIIFPSLCQSRMILFISVNSNAKMLPHYFNLCLLV